IPVAPRELPGSAVASTPDNRQSSTVPLAEKCPPGRSRTTSGRRLGSCRRPREALEGLDELLDALAVRVRERALDRRLVIASWSPDSWTTSRLVDRSLARFGKPGADDAVAFTALNMHDVQHSLAKRRANHNQRP